MPPDTDVDQLLNEIDAPAPERAMTSPETETPAAPEEPAAPQWNGEEWAFESGGKRVIPDSRDKLLTWISKGYDYNHRVGELSKTHAQKMAELEQKYQGFDRYNQINDWAKQNPENWQRLLGLWQERETALAQQNPLDPNLQSAISPLLERLQKTESVLEQWQRQQTEIKAKEEDQALASEIEATRKKYPTIDFDSRDESGMPLTGRILKYADENGISNFKTAFNDYMHDKLIEIARAEGREAIAKDQQKAAKSGLLGKTSAPTKGIQPVQNAKAKSWDAITQEALAELGIN